MRYSDLFSSFLKKSKNKERQLDIQILIEKAFNISKTQYWIERKKIIKDKTGLKKFYRYVGRLLKNEPVAYILKKKDFFSNTFFVNKNVLIPRPETEILVKKAIEIIKPQSEIMEIGAGSGNISITLSKYTNSKITAIEINKKALYILKKNINKHEAEKKIIPVYSNLFPNFKKKFDMIISNPPYISEKEWDKLPSEIKCFEPKQALVGGKYGFEIIEKIITNSYKYLKPKGLLLLEIGFTQKKIVNKILNDNGFFNIFFYDDYNKIPRVVCAQL